MSEIKQVGMDELLEAMASGEGEILEVKMEVRNKKTGEVIGTKPIDFSNVENEKVQCERKIKELFKDLWSKLTFAEENKKIIMSEISHNENDEFWEVCYKKVYEIYKNDDYEYFIDAVAEFLDDLESKKLFAITNEKEVTALQLTGDLMDAYSKGLFAGDYLSSLYDNFEKEEDNSISDDTEIDDDTYYKDLILNYLRRIGRFRTRREIVEDVEELQDLDFSYLSELLKSLEEDELVNRQVDFKTAYYRYKE